LFYIGKAYKGNSQFDLALKFFKGSVKRFLLNTGKSDLTFSAGAEQSESSFITLPNKLLILS
jgi:hypothetical protein